MVIHLISGPRNISTALMYSFVQRADMLVIDEPFYGFYLQYTGLMHPGREAVIASMSNNPEEIFGNIEAAEKIKGNVFVKNMGHHLQGFNYERIIHYRNVFLIRDPKQMLASYSRVRESPTLDDIGLKQQAGLFAWLQKKAQKPIVVNGNDFRKQPAEALGLLCRKLAIPFSSEMLQWPAGPKKIDGIWATYWYASVHQSTGFNPPDRETLTIPDHLLPVYEAALPYYELLNAHSITAV